MGSPETSDSEGRETLPEPTVLDFAEWVQWKVGKCDTPTGGWNYQQFQGKTTPENLPGKLGHPFDCHSSYGN